METQTSSPSYFPGRVVGDSQGSCGQGVKSNPTTCIHTSTRIRCAPKALPCLNFTQPKSVRSNLDPQILANLLARIPEYQVSCAEGKA